MRWAWRRRLLRKEDEHYARLFARRGLTLPDTKSISQHIRQRLPDLRPAPVGNLKTIAVYRHYNWENSSLLEGLGSFGEVRHYDWNVSFAPTPDRFSKTYRREMNEHLLHTLEKWVKEDRPHAIFFYVSGESLLPETLAEIQRWGIPLVNVSFNDKEHFVGKFRGGIATGARDICRYFDVWWTSTRTAMPKFVVEGGRPMYLPEAANPDLHRPFPEEPFLYDVSFVGACYGIRQDIVNWLASQGVNVHTWGYGWPSGPLLADDMVRTYSRSRINLGFATVAAYSDVYCLKGRDFEVPMSGGLYLTQGHPELAEFFRIGGEIATWSDPQTLLGSIHKFLDNPRDAASIRIAGRKRCLAKHSWRHRFESLLSYVGLLKG